MTDIVERLRKWQKHEVIGGDCFDAADEIERLRRLLRWIRDCSVSPYSWPPDILRQVNEALGDER